MKKATILAAAALLVAISCLAYAAPRDSTMLANPEVLGVEVQRGSGGGLQVGFIGIWPLGVNPEGMDADPPEWLECNGQAINAAIYPDLAAIYGSNVPDLRDRFLRGGTAAQAGLHYADSTRSHAHGIDQHSHTVSGSAGAHSYIAPAGGGSSSGWAVHDGDPWTGGWSYTTTPPSTCPGNWSGTGCMRDIGGGVYTGVFQGHHEDPYKYVTYIPTNSGAGIAGSTSGGSISGWTNTAGASSTHASGGAETAPQHTRVRHLIRALR